MEEELVVYTDSNGTNWTYGQISHVLNRIPKATPIQDIPPLGHFDILTDSIGFQNRTASNSTLLVYNRVPKCGSTTMMLKLHEQAYKSNLFKFENIGIYGDKVNTFEKEKKYVVNWKNHDQG